MKKITHEMLKKKGARGPMLDRIRRAFPDGVPVDIESLSTVQALEVFNKGYGENCQVDVFSLRRLLPLHESILVAMAMVSDHDAPCWRDPTSCAKVGEDVAQLVAALYDAPEPTP